MENYMITKSKAAVAAGIATFSAMSIAEAASQDKPNIIVILADDLGYADLSCQGSPDVKTPNIDSLAASGVRCTAGYVTAPQCGPSRAGILSGRYQTNLGLESNEFVYNPGLHKYPLISERLKEAGYNTGYMGKWGVSARPSLHPPKRGFDVTYWNQNGNLFFPLEEYYEGNQVRRGHKDVELEKYSTEAFTDEAIKFVNDQKDDPFFLFLAYITPHVPMEALEKDLKHFEHVEDPLRRTMLAMMKNMDDCVGRLLKTLDKKGIREDTLIFFLSDNGGATPTNTSHCGPNFRGTKTQMLEGGIRIPYIVNWRGKLPEGEVYDNPVSSLDIAATSFEVAGLDIQEDWKLDGVNILPYLKGENRSEPHKALYWRFQFPLEKENQHSFAIRKGKYKLVKNGWAQTPVALYDLENDTREEHNLAKTHPERFQELLKQWEKWNKSTNLKPGTVLK